MQDEDGASCLDRYSVEDDVRYTWLKTAACEPFQTQNLGIQGRGEGGDGRWDAIRRVHANHEVTARSVGEG
jgi:hypothetical protein